MKDHPAKFSDSIVSAIGKIVEDEWDQLGYAPLVIDPFAGVGKIDEAWPLSIGVELEWEWAEQGGRMIQGDALALPFASASIACVATSPCYGNRMADHHNAQEKCRPCGGTGKVGSTQGGFERCERCDGEGRRVYDRLTYRHKLGRMPSEGSSAVMQWGDAYREFHVSAWREVDRVLEPGGLFILNVGDHIRKHKRVGVTAWHRKTVLSLGFEEERRIKVRTPKMKKGENREARVPGETVFAFRKK